MESNTVVGAGEKIVALGALLKKREAIWDAIGKPQNSMKVVNLRTVSV